jgi:hypothetical protein
MLGQQSDLQVEIGSPCGLGSHPVLRDEDKSGEKNRLDRCDHCQDNKTRVEFRQRRRGQIAGDPAPEHDQMDVNKIHAAGEPCDSICDPDLERNPALLCLLPFDHRTNVAIDDSGNPVVFCRFIHQLRSFMSPARLLQKKNAPRQVMRSLLLSNILDDAKRG